MSGQNKALIDRPVVECRQIDFENNVGTFKVLFDNDVTLEEQYQFGTYVEGDGEQQSVSDLLASAELENDPTKKYGMIRQLGTCLSSKIVSGNPDTPQEPYQVEGDGSYNPGFDQETDGIGTEGFWESLGNVVGETLMLTTVTNAVNADNVAVALRQARSILIRRGSEGYQSITMAIFRNHGSAYCAVMTLCETYAAVIGRLENGCKNTTIFGTALESYEQVATEGLFGTTFNAHLRDMMKEYDKAKPEKKAGILNAIDDYRKVLKKKDPCATFAIGAMFWKEAEGELKDRAKAIMGGAIKSPSDQEHYNELLRKAGMGKYCYTQKIATEEMMYGDGLPDGIDLPESAIYDAAKTLVESYKGGKYKSEEAYNADCDKLISAVEDSEEKPSAGEILIAGYAMLFTGDGAVDNAKIYLKQAEKEDAAAISKQAKRILDAIDDASVVEDIPMASYMFDKYDEDLHRDMIKSLTLVSDGKSDDDKGQIKFGSGKEAQRKLEESDDLTPYDLYCIAVILEHSDLDEDSNKAIDKGIEKCKELERDLDVLQFELLKEEIS